MSGPILAELSRLRKLKEATTKSHTTASECKVAISELPFDPVMGAEQLAHAKQQIRDLRHDVAHLEATVVVLKDAMARRQDILDYVRQIILHDASALALFPDESKAAEYQRMFISVLDGDRLHGMSAELERQVLGEQLAALNERVRILDARDATKSKTLKEKDQRVVALMSERDELALQLSKSKAHHSNLYHVLQETKQDLLGSREGLSASKREADMLKQSLEAIMADLKTKENQLAYSQQMVRNLEAQLNTLTSQSEAEKQAAAEMQKQVRHYAAELMRLAEQATAHPVESQPWLHTVQQTVDAAERIRSYLSNSAAFGVIGEPLKQAASSIAAQVGNVRALLNRLDETRRASDTMQSDLAATLNNVEARMVPPLQQLTSSLKRVSHRSEIAAIVETSRRVMDLEGISFATQAAERVVRQLLKSVSEMSDAVLHNPFSNGDRIELLESEVAQLKAQLSEALASSGSLTFDEPKVRALQTLLQNIRTLQESQGMKLSFVPKNKRLPDAVGEFVDAMQVEVSSLRSLDGKPAVPPNVVVAFVDILSADVNLLKMAKRDAQKSAEMISALESTVDRLTVEVQEASGRAIPAPTPAPAPMHPGVGPSTMQLVNELSQYAEALKKAQSAAGDASQASEFGAAREAGGKMTAEALLTCGAAADLHATDPLSHDSRITGCFKSILTCLSSEWMEVSTWCSLLTSVDEPFILMALRNNAAPSSDASRRKLSVRALHAQQLRSTAKPGSITLLGLLSPPPQTVTVPPARTGGNAASQTDPVKQAPKVEFTVEDAIRLLKRAGKWPKVDPKAVSADEYVQTLARRGSYRGTQTSGSGGFHDVATLTDGYLLEGYLGLRRAGDSNVAEPRRRGASIVQIFGDGGILEQVGAGSVEAVQSSMPHRTASSIPSKRPSLRGVDSESELVCVPSKSFRVPSKHSIDNLLQRRQSSLSAALAKPDASSSDSETDSVAQPCDFDKEPFAFQDRGRRPSSAGSGPALATVMLGADFLRAADGSASAGTEDFYALLRHASKTPIDRPNSEAAGNATSAVGMLRRPSSAKSFTGLRERAKQVDAIHEGVVRKSSLQTASISDVAARNKKIHEVISCRDGDARASGEQAPPDRRSSNTLHILRESLHSAQRRNSAPRRQDPKPAEDAGEFAGWDAN